MHRQPNDGAPVRETCAGCGAGAVKLNTDALCAQCERVFLQGDIDAVVAVLEVIEEAARAALRHAAPADIFVMIGRQLAELDAVPPQMDEDLERRARQLEREAR